MIVVEMNCNGGAVPLRSKMERLVGDSGGAGAGAVSLMQEKFRVPEKHKVDSQSL